MKIEVLYPEICNLYGDLANVKYLARCANAEIVTTSLRDVPKFVSEDITLVYMGPTTERGQTLVSNTFSPYLDAFRKRIEQGGLILLTGNALEIFGDYIENEDGSREKMLGMYSTYAKRDMMHRFNGLYLGKFEDTEIVGFKSQFSHSFGDAPKGLFETIRGVGLNPDVKPEGIRISNFMATYVLGPILILNPPFTKKLLSMMGVENPQLAFEEAAMDVYKTRVEEYKKPTTGFIYY